MTEIRPRRSVLAMPGANQRLLVKARTLPTDVVMIDLEDGVAAETRDATREAVARAVAAVSEHPVSAEAWRIANQWADEAIEALAPERESLWRRVQGADFLTQAEKREAVGYPPEKPAA